MTNGINNGLDMDEKPAFFHSVLLYSIFVRLLCRCDIHLAVRYVDAKVICILTCFVIKINQRDISIIRQSVVSLLVTYQKRVCNQEICAYLLPKKRKRKVKRDNQRYT